MTGPHTYTADMYEDAIADAIKDRNLTAAVGLLKLMAVAHPYRCERLLNTLEPTLEALKRETNPSPTT